jgi:rSAM/selenodomain-associated transferase 2
MNEGSVIIPAFNEERTIAGAIESARPLDAEVIVVDGGSTDATVDIALRAGATVIGSARGRGVQLAAGAKAAHGEWLLFLHADSRLGDGAARALRGALADPSFHAGTFRLRLDGPHPLYRLYSWFTRFDSIWTSFGDQGIVIRRDLYEAIGGFPHWPLLEDVRLLQRARTATKIRSLPAEISTSARRFQRNGIVRQQLRNVCILIRYLLGTSPDRLARAYEKESVERVYNSCYAPEQVYGIDD